MILDPVYQFIDDVIEETSNNETYYLQYSKQEKDNVTESFKPIFVGIGIVFSLIVGIITSKLISIQEGSYWLFFMGALALFFYWRRNRSIRKFNDGMREKISSLSAKKSAFISIRKNLNFYYYSRIDEWILQEDKFTKKILRNTLWALYNFDISYDIFNNANFYKKIYGASTTELKKLYFQGFLANHSKFLECRCLLDNVLTKMNTFFIKDEINKLINDNLEKFPRYFLEPCAVTPQHNFYVSLTDYINFVFGSIFKFYKITGYQKGNLILNTKFRKKFLLDKDFNILKIK